MGKARVTRTIAVGKMSDPEPGGDKGDDDDSCGEDGTHPAASDVDDACGEVQ